MHEVETMFWTGKAPWHGLGVEIPEAVNAKQAIMCAGLDWTVSKRPLYLDGGIEVPDSVAIVRDSDNKFLSIVGNKYELVQNHSAFNFMDELVGDGSVKFHVAGALREGKIIWALAKIGSFDVVPSDCVEKYLFLINSHDGSHALRCFFTNTRVVCMNTARIAMESARGEGIYCRHTQNVTLNLAEGRKILNLAVKDFSRFEDWTHKLVQKSFTQDTVQQFVNNVFPFPIKKGMTETEIQEESVRTINKRNDVKKLIETGVGNNIPGVSGTLWSGYNAVVEYANYHRIKSDKTENKQEKLFDTSLFGTGNRLIESATRELTALAA